MHMYRPLRITLFCYECIRLFILLGLFTAFSPEGWDEWGFPYTAYLSANGLFLLMALFLLFDPGLYSGYLSLYGAGKAISLVVFYAGGIARIRAAMAGGDAPFAGDAALFSFPGGWARLGGGVIIALGDALSLLGAGALFVRCRKIGLSRTGKVEKSGTEATEAEKDKVKKHEALRDGVVPVGEA